MSAVASAPNRPIITTPYSHTNPLVLNPCTKTGYCIATALRGPDVESSYVIKSLTAAVLRWFCGMGDSMSMGHYMPVANDPNDAVVYRSDLTSAQGFWRRNFHYRIHIREAFAALNELNVPGGQNYWTWLDGLLDGDEGATLEVRDVYAYHQS